MSRIYENATQLVGHTPIMKMSNYAAYVDAVDATILAKLEYLNPAGSIKDRIALHMIEKAEEEGRLKPGGTVIEPTSGNTGIGLACVAAAKGYKAILTLPETMSMERRTLLKAYGAELVLTDGKLGMQGAIAKAEELLKEIPGSIILGQFVNPDNPETHELTTGPEIWEDTDGKIDILVAGVGTGGTITGIGRYLKSKNPAIKIVGFEPENSAILSGKAAGSHGLQGIGAGFIPKALDTSVYDEIVTVSDADAYVSGRAIAQKEGVLVGITSGAAMYVAAELAKREENKGKVIVAVLPDSGDRYLSTVMFQEQ